MRNRRRLTERVTYVVGSVGLWLFAAPMQAVGEVATKAGLYVDFFPNVGIPNIFLQDPPGGVYRFGDTASQASVNRSGNGYTTSASANGSISAVSATLSANAAVSTNGPDVSHAGASAETFVHFHPGLTLPAGRGRAALSLKITLSGSLSGDAAVSFEAEMPFSFGARYGQSASGDGRWLLRIDNGPVTTDGTGQVSHTFTWNSVPFDFDFPDPFPFDVRPSLIASVGSGGLPGQSAIAATISDFSIRILEHTPPEGPPDDNTGFRWVGPSEAAPSGNFAVATHWRGVRQPEVQEVPVKNDERADAAIFDLNQTYTVNVTNNTTERLIVINGQPTLNLGNYTAAGISLTQPSVAVGNQATLTLVNGTLNSTHAVIGHVPPSGNGPAEVHLLNPNAHWNNPGRLTVGGDGPGRLFVANQSELATGESRIGRSARGEVIVGNRSLWDAANLAVGFDNEGTLTIESGAFVSADQVRLGEFAGARGELRVDGVHSGGLRSRLEANSIDVGFQGVGDLEIESGGHVKAQDMMIANRFGEFGGAAVIGHQDGLPSTLEVTDILRLGASEGAGGQLLIEQGGLVTASNVVIGHLQEGIVTVFGGDSGPRTTLAVTGLFVAGSNPGGLVIETGALVTTSIAGIGGGDNRPEAVGRVRILDPAGPADRLSEWRIADVLSILSNGTLSVGTGGAVTVGQIEPQSLMVRVGPGGILSGNGTIIAGEGVEEAGGLVNFAGTINPGTSPGTLTIDGNYEQGAAGTLLIEWAGLGEELFDRLIVTGDATLGGTLEIQLLDGFLPRAGDAIEFLHVDGTVNGNFARMSFPQLAPGFVADVTISPDGKLLLTARSDAQYGEGVISDLPDNVQLAIDAIAPVLCGGGLCGAGAGLAMPLTVGGLLFMRRRWAAHG